MAQQPSAQGIASLFRGNPAPLQQRIQQEQQGKPGLPPDLHELMALNIVTNETDAMAKQKAMDQLAQMQGPQGKPPTVMDSVREQARQKMEAQAVQAQQQQQGLQALMQQVKSPQIPEGTPQPEAQPQGIDDLPVEFGLAGGGIVAFQSGGQSLNERAARQREEKGSIYDPFFGLPEEERERLRAEASLKAAQDRARESAALVESNAAGLASTAQAKIADLEKNRESLIRQYGAKQYAQAVERAQKDVGAAGARGSELMAQQAQKNQARVAEATPVPKPAAPTAADNRGALNAADAAVRSAPPAPRPVADLKALAEQKRQRPPRPPVEEAAPTPAASSVMPPPQSEVNRFLTEEFQRDPQAGAANKETMYGSRVGPYDPTQRDAMIKQLQDERARQVGPQDSFGQLMEYLGQIAATPRGMTSFEAGAAGARGVRGLDEQRAQKRFDLGAKIIEQEQGKLDGARAYAKELYGVGDKEFDRIYNAKLEAAKRISTDEMEARKLAQQEALKELELKQQATLRREEMRSNEKIAGMRGAGGVGGAADRQQLAELKALQTQYTNQMKTTFNKAERAALQTKLSAVEAAITKMAGLDTMEPAPGAGSLGGTSLKYNPATGKIE
jgi:hypothetical protein